MHVSNIKTFKHSYLWNHWNNGFSNKEDNYGNNCFNTSFDKKQWDHDISSCIKIGKKKVLLKAELYHSNIACKALMPYFFFKIHTNWYKSTNDRLYLKWESCKWWMIDRFKFSFFIWFVLQCIPWEIDWKLPPTMSAMSKRKKQDKISR